MRLGSPFLLLAAVATLVPGIFASPVDGAADHRHPQHGGEVSGQKDGAVEDGVRSNPVATAPKAKEDGSSPSAATVAAAGKEGEAGGDIPEVLELEGADFRKRISRGNW